MAATNRKARNLDGPESSRGVDFGVMNITFVFGVIHLAEFVCSSSIFLVIDSEYRMAEVVLHIFEECVLPVWSYSVD